jgi:uncharacterized cofD-like protein
VLPSTLDKIKLVAEYQDGTLLEGESKIPQVHNQIKRVYIKPASVRPTPEAIKAIAEADAIILGPGSLFTSILPNLLIGGIKDEILRVKVPRIYVCNVMTQPGETDNFTIYDHVHTLLFHTQPRLIDYCIVNVGVIPQELRVQYEQEKSFPVINDSQKVRTEGVTVIEEDVISTVNFVRHNAEKLAHIIVDLVTHPHSRKGQ